MEKREFYNIYFAGLKKALENDHINYGYHVHAPDYYIDKDIVRIVYSFMENKMAEDNFINFVEEYFDAKSHNFPDVGNVDIDTAKCMILNEMEQIKAEYYLE
jgi:hypothetical protein